MAFLATINVPGYLPTDNDPPVFDTAREAWEYLWDEHTDACDYELPLADSHTFADMRNREALGSVIMPTPNYDGDHDLGLVYSVTEVHVQPPLVITSRLMPGLILPDGSISMDYSDNFDDRGAPGFRYHFDLAGESFEGDDLYAPAFEGETEELVLRKAFAALLAFLLTDVERYRRHMGPTPEGEDPYAFPYAFPPTVVEWAYQHDDDLSTALAVLDEDEA